MRKPRIHVFLNFSIMTFTILLGFMFVSHADGKETRKLIADLGAPPPRIIYFKASATKVVAGQAVTLEWQTKNADTVEIAGVGKVPSTGSKTIDPRQQNYFIIIARNKIFQAVSEELRIQVRCPGRAQTQSEPQLETVQKGAPQIQKGFPAPGQLSPASGSRFSHYPRKVTLRWRTVQAATGYTIEVQYCQGSGCASNAQPYKLQSGLKATQYSFNFLGAQPGRWRVWALHPNGKPGKKSPWWEFRFTR